VEPNDFRKWRKGLKLSQKEAAHALGLKRRMIQYYEKGERDGDVVEIPLSVRLACYAIGEGVEDYHGPNRKIKRRDDKHRKDKSDGVAIEAE
jgi:transcriptional regulator with XRE-family HTH domain